MFHTLCYHFNGANPQTNVDMPAVTDPVVTQQQSHYIFTDDFRLGLAYGIGDTLSEIRLNMPSMNAYARHQLWPLEVTGNQPPTVPDLPAVIDYLNAPIQVPENEQMAWELTNNGPVGGEDDYVFLWIFTPDHQITIPQGIQRLTIKATPAAITAVANAWTGPSALTFEQSLRGGWYSVVGLNFVGANVLAMRLIFPRAKQYQGRVLRPGALAQNSAAKRPFNRFMGRLGVYGKFHSFEPPQVEILAQTAGAVTPDMRLDVVYHGEAEPTAY